MSTGQATNAQIDAAMRSGLAALSRGDLAQAHRSFSQVLAWAPHHGDGQNHLGLSLLRMGRAPEALDCFRKRLAQQPNDAFAWLHSGVALALGGQYEPALTYLVRATSLQPQYFDAWLHRGGVLKSLRRFAEAADSFAMATSLAPQHAMAWMERAASLARLERHPEVLQCLEQVLALQPDNVVALRNCAMALNNLGQFEQAVNVLQRAITHHPKLADLHASLGLAYADMRQSEPALACLKRALELAPDDPITLNYCGAAYIKLNRHEEAVRILEPGVQRHPQRAELHSILGMAYSNLNRSDEAIASLGRTLAIDPQNLEAIDNRSLIYLSLGRLAEGFADFEVRWRRPPLDKELLATAAPRWLGQPPLAGKTLLLNREQGLGDSIQFARYATLAAAQGARVILRLPDSLLELLRTIPGVSEVVGETAPLPPHDLYCPMMSLPLAFGTTLENIPAEVPYVQAPPERVSAWRDRLGPKERLRVGLVWAGRQYPPINWNRDMRLASLLPLLQLDVQWISLHKDIPRVDLELLEQLPQIDRCGEQLKDFSDTAALIENLDLLISVDTSVVHLAGALGKPVWILNRFSGCWRWLQDRSDSPWYPSARVFRQKATEQWAPVVDEAREALLELLKCREASPRPGVLNSA